MKPFKVIPIFIIALFAIAGCGKGLFSGKPYNTAEQRDLYIADSTFKSFWISFADSIRNYKLSYVQDRSFDSIMINNHYYASAYFYKNCYKNIFDKTISNAISDPKHSRYTWNYIVRDELIPDARNSVIKDGNIYRLREIIIHKTLSIKFLKTSDEFKFYGVGGRRSRKACK